MELCVYCVCMPEELEIEPEIDAFEDRVSRVLANVFSVHSGLSH